LLVLSGVTLLTLDFRGFGPLKSAQSAARGFLAPIRDGAQTVTRPVTNAGRGLVDYGQVKEENERLRQELDTLKGLNLQSEVDTETLKRLLAQHDIAYLQSSPRVTARVVAGSVGNFDEFSVEIDKGSNHGLLVDMPVVTGAGLVGRLVQVDAARSRVQLITAPQFAVGVRVGQEVLLARGTGLGNPLRAQSNIPIDAPIEVGDIALTHGQDRSRFPPDIPVGRVRSVDRSSGSVVLQIEPVSGISGLDIVLYTGAP
jgi:rod shape-determining protein MreC